MRCQCNVQKNFQVRPKYLRCVGITCFYLAAKTCEEDEVTVTFVLYGKKDWQQIMNKELCTLYFWFSRWSSIKNVHQLV